MAARGFSFDQSSPAAHHLAQGYIPRLGVTEDEVARNLGCPVCAEASPMCGPPATIGERLDGGGLCSEVFGLDFEGPLVTAEADL